jgi:hypothetical protein
MKSKFLLFGALCAAVMAAACHNNDGSTPATTTAPTSSAMALDTAQVLALAQATSETSSPFTVNGGAFSFTDTSETSSPISVAQ